MVSPIRIYLDSSDYAALAGASPTSSLWPVRQQLLASVAAKSIEIGMSYFNVFELLQEYAPEFKQDRLERARLLRDLCGTNAFPHVSDLYQGATFCSDATWLPSEAIARLDVKILADGILDGIRRHPNLNRAARKRLSNRKWLAEFLRENPDRLNLASVDSQEWPFPQECLEPDLMRRYLLGELSRSEANLILRRIVCDPVSLLEVWFDYYKKPNPLTADAHEMAAKLRQSINDLRHAIHNFHAFDKGLKTLRRETYRLQNPALQKKVRDGLRLPLEFDPHNPGPDFFYEKVALLRERLPETQGRLLSAALMALVLRDREFQDSDMVDLIHLAYLPLCDLWRGDKAFCDALARAQISGHEKLVHRLVELPDRIDQLMRKRAA